MCGGKKSENESGKRARETGIKRGKGKTGKLGRDRISSKATMADWTPSSVKRIGARTVASSPAKSPPRRQELNRCQEPDRRPIQESRVKVDHDTKSNPPYRPSHIDPAKLEPVMEGFLYLDEVGACRRPRSWRAPKAGRR